MAKKKEPGFLRTAWEGSAVRQAGKELHDPRLWSNVRGMLTREPRKTRVEMHRQLKKGEQPTVLAAMREGWYRGEKQKEAMLCGLFDELEKISGVGVDIHGYHRKPENPALQKAYDAHDRQMVREVGSFPTATKRGPIGRLVLGKWKQPSKASEEEWHQRSQAFLKKNPAPEDPYDYEIASRVKTPFDRASSRGYKVHDRVLSGGDAFYDMYTDTAYSDKPRVVNLNRQDMKRLRSEYDNLREGKYPKEEKAFLQKIDHLMKDKRVRFARLEYE